MKVPMIKGKNVILRPMSLQDSKDLYNWFNDEEVARFLQIYDDPPQSVDEEREKIRDGWKDEDTAPFSIDTSDGMHIGWIALGKISKVYGHALLGVCIGEKKYWGQGYGTEAEKLIMDFGFKKLKLHRIYLHVYAFNIRGIQSYRKLGFKKEGILRENLYRDGYYHNEIIMGILKSEYLKK